MSLRVARVPNAFQAWQIAVLTVIVIVVGCSRSERPRAPQQPNRAAAPARDALQRDVNELQSKVDATGAAITKTETTLEEAKQKLAEQAAKAEPDAALRDSLAKKVADLEAAAADQRSELESFTKELTARNIELQKSQHAADAGRKTK